MPIAPIPAGSGNALCVNLLGNKKVDDYAWASLGVIKGRAMALDLCSFTQGEKRIFSFLSVASGLVADLDLGTEHLRSVLECSVKYATTDIAALTEHWGILGSFWDTSMAHYSAPAIRWKFQSSSSNPTNIV